MALEAVLLVLLILNLGLALYLALASARQGGRLLKLEFGFEGFERGLEKSAKGVEESLARMREEAGRGAREGREEQAAALKGFQEGLAASVRDASKGQAEQLALFASQLAQMGRDSEARLEKMREVVEARLKELQADNSQKLEQMRATVDEKLQSTLEKRLGESFQIVSERLEKVHQGLGEMQGLAVGVGDLKKVLTNVKTRGIFGEIQLGSLLEEVLPPQQYHRNHATKRGSRDVVEYAIRLPGQGPGEEVLLPVDAKFPTEDYQRLVEAYEQSNPAAVEEARKQLEARLKGEARDIREKYVDPPATTAFGLLFLPTEGLYAEALRIPGLFEELQHKFRVTLTGPSTLLAFLNSLQMGFRTLAIEKKTNEVWSQLSQIKGEFSKFSELLEHTRKKLQEASNSIETAASKSRSIETKLKKVESLPQTPARERLPEPEPPARVAGGSDTLF